MQHHLNGNTQAVMPCCEDTGTTATSVTQSSTQHQAGEVRSNALSHKQTSCSHSTSLLAAELNSRSVSLRRMPPPTVLPLPPLQPAHILSSEHQTCKSSGTAVAAHSLCMANPRALWRPGCCCCGRKRLPYLSNSLYSSLMNNSCNCVT